MSLPDVKINERDGALGVLPPSSGKLYALIGSSTSGPINAPATYARVPDLQAGRGGGPLIEAAAHEIEFYGRPVVVVRVDPTKVTKRKHPTDEDDEFLPPARHVTGTSVVTIDATSDPVDDYEVVVRIVTGGTRGTAGITYAFSIDGGRSYSATLALGTATTLTVGDTGVKFALATGTLVAGDYWSCVAFAPTPTDDGFADALAALRAASITWGTVHLVGVTDLDVATVADSAMTNMAAIGKARAWIGNIRMPDLGNDLVAESEEDYRDAAETILAAIETTHGMICGAAVRFRSSISGTRRRYPWSYLAAARQATVSEEINIADVNLGPMPAGATIHDSNGNPEQHDETINPGLDDLGLCTARSWESLAGVYVTRPRLKSAPDSDFQLMPHRQVINLTREVLRPYFIRRLNAPIVVDKTTGFILETEALEIEAGANAKLRDALGATPKASAWRVVVSRNDNLLSTKTMHVTARVVPLAYPEEIDIDLGFENPALQVVAA